MKKYTLIAGNISFDTDTAKIHSIDFVQIFDSFLDAENMGEDLVNQYGAYIIPEVFNNTPIIFEIL